MPIFIFTHSNIDGSSGAPSVMSVDSVAGRLRREISVERMGYKDDRTKQGQDCRYRFNHFDAPCYITRYV
jgi:hypothetical protein